MLSTLLLLPKKQVKAPVCGEGRKEPGSVPGMWPWAAAQSPGGVAQVELLGSLQGTAPLQGPALGTRTTR